MLGIYNAFGYAIDWQERYDLIKAAGFDSVMLWWSDGFGRWPGYQKDPERARSAGLVVENLHAPVQWQNDLSLDDQDGESLLEVYSQCVRGCAQYQVPAVVIHLPNDQFPLSELGMERIGRLTELAGEHGVKIAMEGIFNTRNLCKALDSFPTLGLCYDSCHYANDPVAPDLLGLYGHRLMALHLHDNGGERGQHRLPFDGDIDWPRVMGEITETGYKGPISLEPMNWGYEHMDIREFLGLAYERAVKLENSLF